MDSIVYVAASRDWFDYLATGATLLLSAIAVIIALSTARRQNKIALFKERYDTFQIMYQFFHAWEASLLYSSRIKDKSVVTLDDHSIFIYFFSKSLSNISSDLLTDDFEDIDGNVVYSHYMNILLHIHRVDKLFRLSNIDREYIHKIEEGYIAISAKMAAGYIASIDRKSSRDENFLTRMAIAAEAMMFKDSLKSYKSFLESLENQVNVCKYL